MKNRILSIFILLSLVPFYTWGQKPVITEPWYQAPGAVTNDSLLPPVNLTATVTGDDVALSWLPPGGGEGTYLQYCSDTLGFLIGFTDGGVWSIAARWDEEQLAPYDGAVLTKVDYIPGSSNTAYTLNLWKGPFPEPELIYQQVIIDTALFEWNEVFLNNPLVIDASQELWIGIEYEQAPEEYPAVVDFGPAIPEYGDLIKSDENDWMSAAALGINNNWSIRGFVSGIDGPVALPLPGKNTGTREPGHQPDIRNLAGYNIYRDGEQLNTIPVSELFYDDTDLDNGIYQYKVTAVYDTLESIPDSTRAQIGGPLLAIEPDTVYEVLAVDDTATILVELSNTGEEVLLWNGTPEAGWITLSASSGEIFPGENQQIEMVIDPQNLVGGIYAAQVLFDVNNLSFPQEILQVYLDVEGTPQIELLSDTLDFGTVLLNQTSTGVVTIYNTGTDTLTIDTLFTQTPAFSYDYFVYPLVPGEGIDIEVYFTPDQTGIFADTLLIFSNDPDNGITPIYLFGEGDLLEPLNLTAQVSDNNVFLSWNDPMGGPGSWLYYGTGEPGQSIGLTEGGTWEVAARWEPEQLTVYNGELITKVRLFLLSENTEYFLKIWVQDSLPEILAYQQVTDILINEWTDVYLETPIPIGFDGDLWIGYEMIQEPEEFPAGCDTGPAITGYGDLVSFDGATWLTLTDYGLDYNWNIQAFVSEGSMMSAPVKPAPYETGGVRDARHTLQVKNLALPIAPETRDLAGYNIYRNGEQINDVPVVETYYADSSLAPGTYSYEVTALYDEGESSPAGPVTVTIESMPEPPNGWTMTPSTIAHVIHFPLNIDMLPPGLIENGDWIGVFFEHEGDHVLAGMGYWNGLEMTDVIAYGDHQGTPGKDGFWEGDELVWMLYKESWGTENFINVSYDTTQAYHDGKFHNYAHSWIQSVSFSPTATAEKDPGLLKVYPVPATSFVYINEVPLNSTIKLFDLQGKLLVEQESTIETRIQLDIPPNTSGVYLLQVINGHSTITRKILIGTSIR